MSGTARLLRKGEPHGLVSVDTRWHSRSRLGFFHEAIARLHAAPSHGRHLGDDDRQLRLLSIAMRTLPLGTAYTIWTGIGAVGAFLVGIFILGESANPLRITAALLIVVGLALMKLSSPA